MVDLENILSGLGILAMPLSEVLSVCIFIIAYLLIPKIQELQQAKLCHFWSNVVYSYKSI